MKAFGSLVKGLRIAMDLLMLMHKEGHIIPSLSRIFKPPIFDGSDGLDKFLTQFEAAIDSDFPDYQVCFFLLLHSASVSIKGSFVFEFHISCQNVISLSSTF